MRVVFGAAIVAGGLALSGLVHVPDDVLRMSLEMGIVLFYIYRKSKSDKRLAKLTATYRSSQSSESPELSNAPNAPNASDGYKTTVESTKKAYILRWQDAYGKATAYVIKPSGANILLDYAATGDGDVQAFENNTGEVVFEACRPFEGASGIRQVSKELLKPYWLFHKESEYAWKLPITYSLILANIGLYSVCAHFKQSNFLHQKTSDMIAFGDAVGNMDETWRLITTSFLHFTWWHLAFNMVGLIYLGSICEPKLGAIRYVCLYLFCTIASNLVEALIRGGATNEAGASNSVMALAGFLFAFLYLQKSRIKSPLARKNIRWFLDIFLLAILGSFLTGSRVKGYEVDQIGHLAGFAFGMIGAWIFPKTNWRTRLGVSSLVFIFLIGTYYYARERYVDHHLHEARALLAMSRAQYLISETEFEQAAKTHKAELPAQRKMFSADWLISVLGSDSLENLAYSYNSAAWMAITDRKYELGNRLADKALLIKYDPEILDTRSLSFLGLGNYKLAESDLLKALALRQHFSAFEFHLAQSMLLEGGENYLRTRFPKGYKFDYEPEDWEYRFGRP